MRLVCLSALVVCLSVSGASLAEENDGGRTDTPASSREAKPWLYLDDPSLPEALAVTAFSRATYTNGGASLTRPFGAGVAHPGAVLELGAEAGLTRWLSIEASGASLAAGPNGGIGAMAGLRFAPFASRWRTTHLVVSAGFLRDLDGDNGAWGRVALTQDVGRARFAAMAHGEHMAAAGRDAVDFMVTAGASVRVAGPLRAGLEYVAQDLEGAIDREELEGGVRHFIGPTLGLELLDKRLTVTGGPAAGLSPESPRAVGRIAVGYAF